MMKENHLKILMFPWLAHGHVSPYLELAKKLAARNFTIYLCTTSATLSSIKHRLDNIVSSGLMVHFVELHLPTLTDLPPEFHTTNGLPSELMNTLKDAFSKSCHNFYKILEDLKPDLLIYDFLQPWAPGAAKVLGIPVVEFITSSATMTAFTLHDAQNPGVPFLYPPIYERDYEILKQKVEGTSAEKRAEDRKPILQSHERSDLILVKSFKEIEGTYCDYLSKLSGKKIVPVGPLVQDPCNDTDESEGTQLFDWLDQKQKCSTIFIAFGSEYFLSKRDIKEIVHGLQLSTANFIWVLRFPKGSEDVKLDEALPKDFFKKVGNRGKVITGWAPQTRILNHSAIGGFVSHCGWSSVMESMKFGVPIIAMPMHIDQPINARLVEEVGVGAEVIRDRYGELHGLEIAGVINKVLTEKSYVKKAEWLKNKIKDNGEKEIDGLVQVLGKLCKIKVDGEKEIDGLVQDFKKHCRNENAASSAS